MIHNRSFFKRIKVMALALVLIPLICPSSILAQVDLTGVWNCDDGGTYYIRQIDGDIFWYGEQSSANSSWSNVARGYINDSTIILDWANIPKGSVMNSGVLTLNIVSNDKLTAIKTGEFNGSTWGREIKNVSQRPMQPGTPATVKTASDWYNKGNSLLGQGKYNEAIQAYEEAIKQNPQYANAWNNKGFALKLLHRDAEADAAFNKARELGLNL